MKPILSEINIVPIKPTNGLVAFASVVLDKQLYLGSIGIMTRPSGGYRLTYPTRKIGQSSLNIYFPIDKHFAQYVEWEILRRYDQVLNSSITTLSGNR